MKSSRLLTSVILTGILAGCASSASRYYTLSPAENSRPTGTPVQSAAAASPHFAISVQPVVLPEQVDKPQIVVSAPDSAQITPLNQSLWASPLSDEIRNALANDLSRQLGVLDISVQGAPAKLPIWKIYLTVQRFESVYNQQAVLEATWRLTPVNQTKQPTRICRAQAQVPVAPGIPALVAGQQEVLHRFASAIAAQLSGRSFSDVTGITVKGCTKG